MERYAATRPLGFLRARELAQEMRAMVGHPMPAAEKAQALRSLMAQIDHLGNSREPIPDATARIELSIQSTLEGAPVEAKDLMMTVSMLGLAIEAARVGVEQGLPEDYWKRPSEYSAGGEAFQAPTPEEIREAIEAGQLVDLQAFRKGRGGDNTRQQSPALSKQLRHREGE